MSKKINLLGEVDNFFLALKDRLDRAGASFTSDSEDADITVGLGKYAANESVDIAIIAENEDSRSGNICLLYTSPSPRDRTRSRMPSSA